jgi:hypothetical protein
VIAGACGGSKLASDAAMTDSSIDAPIDGAPAAPLAYFGYWRDALTGSTAEIQDHANISLVDDSVGNILITPISGVNLCDDCDVGGLSTDQWATRKSQIEASETSYPSAHHFMITLGDGNGDGHLDFQGIPGFALPAGIDWVGLECYPVLGWSSCKANIEQLEPLMPSNGRFWVLIPAETEYGSEDALVANAREMYEGARAEPLVVGLIGFVWTNAILCPPADCTQVFATKQLPALASEMKCIGQAITRPGSPTSC